MRRGAGRWGLDWTELTLTGSESYSSSQYNWLLEPTASWRPTGTEKIVFVAEKKRQKGPGKNMIQERLSVAPVSNARLMFCSAWFDFPSDFTSHAISYCFDLGCHRCGQYCPVPHTDNWPTSPEIIFKNIKFPLTTKIRISLICLITTPLQIHQAGLAV